MKIGYLKLKNWLLIALGGLVGINLVGCEKVDNPALAYGAPTATYHVKGTVTNDKGQPIPGIVVKTRFLDDSGDTTDADGRFDVSLQYVAPQWGLRHHFYDVDGDENGRYNDTTVTIKTDEIPLVGGQGFFQGEGWVRADIKLTEKTNK